MEEDMQHCWHFMFYYFKKGKNANETQKLICVYGESTVTHQMCHKWFIKFLGTIDIWANNSLLWGCLMHWKMFSSTPASMH